MYRSIQFEVVLLAAGTILGGVWADYSWGRFWGWDPKEVWALIALLLYVAVLHGRFTNWLRGFGFAAVTVISFLGVLMAWYGVNFVLGAGLHSYGFGSGGIAYVLVYLAVQVAFILFAYGRHRSSGNAGAAIFPKGHR
ncbi:MAG: cytochrome c biogenesis protein CcsA [Bdellovibrionales bacterium]|nr:cytochrome c biogenesis protein CcsA [Bdellovibrionales bacterium]